MNKQELKAEMTALRIKEEVLTRELYQATAFSYWKKALGIIEELIANNDNQYNLVCYSRMTKERMEE